MNRFAELNLSPWKVEELEDVFEEYPELESMDLEEMEKFANKLYWEANNHINQANFLENKADSIYLYIQQTISK